MSVGSSLRPRPEVEAVYEKVRLERDAGVLDPDLTDYVTGADGELAAMDWALGRVDAAPLTGRVDGDVDRYELDRERRVATDMLYRRHEMHRRGRFYVSAVETTVMWILGESDNEPF